VAETPDFEQIARRIVVDWLGETYDADRRYGLSNPDYRQPEEVDDLVVKLRDVWNALGATDIASTLTAMNDLPRWVSGYAASARLAPYLNRKGEAWVRLEDVIQAITTLSASSAGPSSATRSEP